RDYEAEAAKSRSRSKCCWTAGSGAVNGGYEKRIVALETTKLDGFSGGEIEMARPKRFELVTPRFVVWVLPLAEMNCDASRRSPQFSERPPSPAGRRPRQPGRSRRIRNRPRR